MESISLKMLDVAQPLAPKDKEIEMKTKDIDVLSTTNQYKSTEVQTMDADFPSNLNDVWKDFDIKLQEEQEATASDQQKIVHSLKNKSQDSFTAEPFDKLISTKRV